MYVQGKEIGFAQIPCECLLYSSLSSTLPFDMILNVSFVCCVSNKEHPSDTEPFWLLVLGSIEASTVLLICLFSRKTNYTFFGYTFSSLNVCMKFMVVFTILLVPQQLNLHSMLGFL